MPDSPRELTDEEREIVGVCDTCAALATNLARDVYEFDNPLSSIQRHYLGTVKRGCDLHPVRSHYYDRLGKLLG
jgi:hypothetical protein